MCDALGSSLVWRWKVLKRDGINLSRRVSSEHFMGNAEAAQGGARMIEREPTTVLSSGVGKPPANRS